uniref:Bestrophin homolog n=2 Tax=Bursaphelenchus xylophilus TaxID=6326 RepID=A0A1I7SGH7_BURXY
MNLKPFKQPSITYMYKESIVFMMTVIPISRKMWVELLASGVICYELYYRLGEDHKRVKRILNFVLKFLAFILVYCLIIHYLHSLPSYHDLEETLDT